MYEEHPNGSMIKIDSRNIYFFEDDLQSTSEIKKGLELYESW